MDDDSKLTGLDDATPARHTPDDRSDAASSEEAEKPAVFNVARPGGRRAFLQTLSRSAAVGATAVAGTGANCNPSSPTPASSTTTTTAATTSTTTSVATTTAQATFTIAGVVSDRSGRAVGGARVFVVDGPNANKSSNTDGNGYYSIPGIIPGSFTLRTTLNGVFLNDVGVTVSRDTRLDFSVTTTSTTTTSTTPTSITSSTTGGTSHYWYPN